MSTQAPASLFNNSQPESLTPTPELKINDESPESALQSSADVYDPNDEEWRDFDGDNYQKRALKRVPILDEADENWADKLAPQLWIARHFPLLATRWLVADMPGKTLWKHLSADELGPLKYEGLRGFQQAPGSLRREPVQKRFAVWLEKHPEELHLLLLLWAHQTPQPQILPIIAEQNDKFALKEQLPSLIRTFGPGAVAASIAIGGDPALFCQLRDIITDEENLLQIMRNAPLYAPDEATETNTTVEAPQADSEAAHFWRAEADKMRELMAKMEAQLASVRGDLNNQASAKTKVRSLENEIANLQKREEKKAKNFAKKLEQIEQKWAGKYSELNKIEAREERRVRALQSQIEELELSNKRQKKQLRQSALSREEERRKVVALEAQLAELNGDKPATKTKSVDAVSSPPTTQDAPNRPVKVSRPSPLDEIFEWNTQGHRIRLTAREVRRLIDKNDEERVGKVMLELEFLRETNPDLRKRFLERLSLAGTHYARVLTHRTSRVLVDASNVARFLNNRYGKGQLKYLQLMRQELQRLDCWPIIFVADASLPYNIDQPAELREMARQGEIIITDKGVEADEILAREARATGAYVVTNDAKFFYKVSPDYEPPRITFRVLDGLVVVDEF